MPVTVLAALWGGKRLCSPAALRPVSLVISGEHRPIPAGEAYIKPAFLFYVPATWSQIRRKSNPQSLTGNTRATSAQLHCERINLYLHLSMSLHNQFSSIRWIKFCTMYESGKKTLPSAKRVESCEGLPRDRCLQKLRV